MNNLRPFEIVAELDKYIVGQNSAKRSVAIALRNRWRRQQVTGDLKNEIPPKNIILIGPTGVGKTEISRRLSKLTDSPFSKVDASKFTEVGYVGRDVESMVRDLVNITISNVRVVEQDAVKEKAAIVAEERILDLLVPSSSNTSNANCNDINKSVEKIDVDSEASSLSTKEKFRKMLRDGKLNDRYVEVDFPERSSPMIEVISGFGVEDIGSNIKEMIGSLIPKNTKRRKMKVCEAIQSVIEDEVQNLIDMNKVIKLAIEKVEQNGIIFLDEIDKIITTGSGGGPDVSREGVQRDLLPIVEGSTVTTKYGPVKTDNILFIASGAFHTVKPSDLIPELQGRFPIRVELDALGRKDFYKILTEPENALLIQYVALLKADGVKLSFDDDAVEKISEIAEYVNTVTENIGARRLHTLMECLLEDILFDAPGLLEENCSITRQYVESKLDSLKSDEDLNRYII